MDACNFFEDAIMNFLFKAVAFGPPTALYLALSTADPTETGAGLVEPVGNGYVRRSVLGSWSIDSPSRVGTISPRVDWPEATGSWGSISHLALLDASTGGNVYARGTVPGGPLSVAAGEQPTLNAGTVTWTMTGAWSDYVTGEVFDHVLNGNAFSSPSANIHLALSRANPLSDGSGLDEPASGDGYLRTPLPGSEWSLPGGGSGLIENLNNVDTPDATSTWGTITHVALFDAASGGNMLMFSALDSAAVVSAGKRLRFLAGNLNFSVD